VNLRLIRLALIASLLPAPLLAQQPSGLPGPDKSLWPERPLSPAEQELRAAVVVLRDTLYTVEATAARVERGLQGSPAVLRSTGRTLKAECARGARATGTMRAYAMGLSTDNARWGEVALTDFRKALTTLETAMGNCDQISAKAIEADPVDAAALKKAQVSTVLAIRDYERSVKGLLRTLNIQLDPRGTSTPTIY
jgi:hypothetical protein